MTVLEDLPRPVYFVCRNRERWGELLDGKGEVTLAAQHEKFRDARESWSVQPYIQLKQRGLDVRLVEKPVVGEICIVTSDELYASELPYRSFIVCCRHDRGIPMICNQRIVQNQLNVLTPQDHYLPHWPQPFITPRNPARGERLENVSYKGRLINLAKPFRSGEFQQKLAEFGVQLLTSPEDDAARVADSRDYSEVDMVLAVRDSTEYNLSIKPPSKLINSWIAGCPSIMGPEPAYQQLRLHPLDYFEIRTVDEAVEYIKIMKENRNLFVQAQERCRIRAQEFSADSIAKSWRDLLAGPIFDAYTQWTKESILSKALGRPAKFFFSIRQHKEQKKIFLRSINEGHRYFT